MVSFASSDIPDTCALQSFFVRVTTGNRKLGRIVIYCDHILILHVIPIRDISRFELDKTGIDFIEAI